MQFKNVFAFQTHKLLNLHIFQFICPFQWIGKSQTIQYTNVALGDTVNFIGMWKKLVSSTLAAQFVKDTDTGNI